MKSKIVVLLVVLFQMSFVTNAQVEVGGVQMPANLSKVDANWGSKLSLNGAGVREKYFLDLYVGGLYTSQKYPSAERVIAANAPMAIRLEIVSSLISSTKMADATEEGFEKSSKSNKAALQDRVESFKDIFRKEEIVKGDVYDIVYIPEEGTIVYKNNVKKSVIPGHDFKKGLFGIWLCDSPADEDLKEDMLNIK